MYLVLNNRFFTGNFELEIPGIFELSILFNRIELEWAHLVFVCLATPGHRGPLRIADRRCNCRTPRFLLPRLSVYNLSSPRNTGPSMPFWYWHAGRWRFFTRGPSSDRKEAHSGKYSPPIPLFCGFVSTEVRLVNKQFYPSIESMQCMSTVQGIYLFYDVSDILLRLLDHWHCINVLGPMWWEETMWKVSQQNLYSFANSILTWS